MLREVVARQTYSGLIIRVLRLAWVMFTNQIITIMTHRLSSPQVDDVNVQERLAHHMHVLM